MLLLYRDPDGSLRFWFLILVELASLNVLEHFLFIQQFYLVFCGSFGLFSQFSILNRWQAHW